MKSLKAKLGVQKEEEVLPPSLLESWVSMREMDKKDKFQKRYLVLTEDDGILRAYNDEKRKKLLLEFDFLNPAIDAFFRMVIEDEADELNQLQQGCFLLMAGVRAPDAKKPDAAYDRVGFFVAPLPATKKPTEEEAAELTGRWVMQLSKKLTMGKAPENKGGRKAGTRVVVDPSFRQGAFSVPARFEWFGTAAHLKVLMGLPPDVDVDLELVVEYKRKMLVGKNTDKGWKAIACVPTGLPGGDGTASFRAEAVIPAGKGYQSRWRVRRRPNLKLEGGDRLPNCLTVTVSRGRGLLPVNSASLLSMKAVDANPVVTVEHNVEKAKTEEQRKTLEPVWERGPMEMALGIDPHAERAKQAGALQKLLKKPIVFNVTSGRKSIGYLEIVPEAVASEQGVAKWYRLQKRPARSRAGAKQDNVGEDDAAPPEGADLGEVEVAVSWSYQDHLDPTWISVISPLRKAPNLVFFLRDKVPAVEMMCAQLPRDKWEIRNFDAGGSRAKQLLKDRLLELEELMPYNTWDVLAETVALPGQFENNLYVATVAEKATRAASEQANNPKVQYKVRSESLKVPFMAVKKGLTLVKVNLDSIFPDPLALVIPKDTEMDLEKLKKECDEDPTREAKTLDLIDIANLRHPEEEYGLKMQLAPYEEIRNAVYSKRPTVDEEFRLPLYVEWVPGKKDQDPKAVTFYWASAKIRPPIAESLKRKQKEAKSKASSTIARAGSIVKKPGKSEREDGGAAGDGGHEEGGAEAEAEADAEDVDAMGIDADDLDYPEWVPTIDQLDEVCRQSKFVKDVYVHRTSDPFLPVTTAVVVVDVDAIAAWAAEQKMACTDVRHICTLKRTELAVFEDLQAYARRGVLSGPGVAVAGTGDLNLGAKDKEVIQQWDFVRGVHLVTEGWPEGTDRDALAAKYSAELTKRLEESQVEMAVITSDWVPCELSPPKEGKAWQAQPKVKAGPIAYKWKMDDAFYYEKDKFMRAVMPEEENNFKIMHVVAKTPFGIGMDVGV